MVRTGDWNGRCSIASSAYELISVYQAEYPTAMMCRVLEVSTSGYYAWLTRPASARAIEDRILTEMIRTYHKESIGDGTSPRTYGAPRIHADLKDAGIHIGRKRIARLMREAGLRGVSRCRFVRTTKRDKTQRAARDLVERNFEATRPDELWVADITFVPTATGSRINQRPGWRFFITSKAFTMCADAILQSEPSRPLYSKNSIIKWLK